MALTLHLLLGQHLLERIDPVVDRLRRLLQPLQEGVVPADASPLQQCFIQCCAGTNDLNPLILAVEAECDGLSCAYIHSPAAAGATFCLIFRARQFTARPNYDNQEALFEIHFTASERLPSRWIQRLLPDGDATPEELARRGNLALWSRSTTSTITLTHLGWIAASARFGDGQTRPPRQDVTHGFHVADGV